MQFGTKNNRPAARTKIQCALDHDAACNTAVAEADMCEAGNFAREQAPRNEPIFPARKHANAMTFTVDLHDAWTRA